MNIPSGLLDAFPSADLRALHDLASLYSSALKSSSNKNIKALRCAFRSTCTTEQERTAFIKWTSSHNLEHSICFEERLAYLYILNDLLHWAGDRAPDDLISSIRSVALISLRAGLHAPDIKHRRPLVEAVLARWKAQKYFESIAFASIEAGLLLTARAGQYDYHIPSNPPILGSFQLGRSEDPYWKLPASTMLPHLMPYEERQRSGMPPLTEIPIDSCRPIDVLITQSHLDAITSIPNTHPFPEREEDEEDQWSYEGWDREFWRKRTTDFPQVPQVPQAITRL